MGNRCATQSIQQQIRALAVPMKTQAYRLAVVLQPSLLCWREDQLFVTKTNDKVTEIVYTVTGGVTSLEPILWGIGGSYKIVFSIIILQDHWHHPGANIPCLCNVTTSAMLLICMAAVVQIIVKSTRQNKQDTYCSKVMSWIYSAIVMSC